MAKLTACKPNCPIEKTIEIIGRKYAVLIIRDLLSGKKRFGELLASISGISPRTLSARLDELENDRIIRKKIYPVTPLHVEYSLTESGAELHAIIDQMNRWGAGYKK
jgi:DNA-binding HxlR family transcriptional regulator